MLVMALLERKKKAFWIPLVALSAIAVIGATWQLSRERRQEDKRIADSTSFETRRTSDSLTATLHDEEICINAICGLRELLELSVDEIIERSPHYRWQLDRILSKQVTKLDSAVFCLLAFEPDRALQLLSAVEMCVLTDSIAMSTWNVRGIANMMLVALDSAVAAFDSVLVLRPDHFEALLNMGAALDLLGRYSEALSFYERALKVRRDDLGLWCNMSFALNKLERYEDALKCSDSALEIKKDCYDALYDKGFALFKLHRCEEAIMFFDAALKDPQNVVDALLGKGNCLSELGQFGAAVAAYDSILRFEPDNYRAAYNKACVYSLWHKKAEMLENLRRAIALIASHKEMAIRNPDFEFYRSDPDFRALVGLPPLD
ncbi:MAG: tetratricopeptide repeat protein [Calditrichaeota bacterium]|nr:tetratricopeptide repeat protein [Calditrichota bacterium]